MGLSAFVVFIVPWMFVAFWLFWRPGAARLGIPATPWRLLSDFPDPPRDQRMETNPHNAEPHTGAGPDGGNKHEPFAA